MFITFVLWLVSLFIIFKDVDWLSPISLTAIMNDKNTVIGLDRNSEARLSNIEQKPDRFSKEYKNVFHTSRLSSFFTRPPSKTIRLADKIGYKRYGLSSFLLLWMLNINMYILQGFESKNIFHQAQSFVKDKRTPKWFIWTEMMCKIQLDVLLSFQRKNG